MERFPPLAVTLNDVVVDAEALLVAGTLRDRPGVDDLQRALGTVKHDVACIAREEVHCLERAQFSLTALVDAVRFVSSGLDVDDPLSTLAISCRRKTHATLFTLQWLLARRSQHPA